MTAITARKTIAPVGGYYRIVIGTYSMTGTVADLDTGLAQILYAYAVPKVTEQGATTNTGYCTVDFGSDGLLDIYGWTNAGVASSVLANTILIMAIGY